MRVNLPMICVLNVVNSWEFLKTLECEINWIMDFNLINSIQSEYVHVCVSVLFTQKHTDFHLHSQRDREKKTKKKLHRVYHSTTSQHTENLNVEIFTCLHVCLHKQLELKFLLSSKERQPASSILTLPHIQLKNSELKTLEFAIYLRLKFTTSFMTRASKASSRVEWLKKNFYFYFG